jgi:chorismate mutase/prephenate dehydratase
MLTDSALEQLRQAIDHIDIELLNLLAKRSQYCNQVGEHKVSANLQTRDLDREKDLIQKKITLGKQLGLNEFFVHQLFDLIIEQSVKHQYQMKIKAKNPDKPRVAYLGDQGSYSHQALNKYFSQRSSAPTPFAYKTFKDILTSVQDNTMDIGILPIENTTSGAILEVYDLLQGSGIHIIGEEILEIRHCLVGHKHSHHQISTVLGHPQAITQCNDLIQSNSDWTIEYCASSADALEQVIKRNEPGVVAVANEFAAELYQLDVRKSNTANNRNNFTRFIVIGKQSDHIPEEVPCKVSIVFATRQNPGALADVLNELKQQSIVLTKLQSRPVPEKPWEELFYADLEGHLHDPKLKQAIKHSEEHCQYLKILGCYPNCQLEKPTL